MCIPHDMELVSSMTDQGTILLINEHPVPVDKIKVRVAEELGLLTFQNSGANTLWGDSWAHVQEETLKRGITLPDSASPCITCDGYQCRFQCTRH